VLFPGEVRNVPALLARSAFLALTSDYEGFPNVILEAMAARLPVLTVPAGDAELIVRNGQTGSVVDAEDIRNISRCMVEFAHSDATRREFGEAGRERVEQNYNHESLAKELTSIFHAFATQRQGRHWRDIRLRLQRVATASEIEEGLEFGRAASGLHKL
jgi:glycosyltransferase involved in cell wall biosynthesis